MIDRRFVIQRSGVTAGVVALAAAGLGSPAPAAAAPTTPATGFLPLPEHAKPLPMPPEGYRLERVGKNGYVVSAGIAQGYFFVTRTGVVMLDAVAKFLPLASSGSQTSR
ncbi:hypothetical protein [Streptomyces sp. NBC_00258]|uniref:hypothetical protein n=1 Tax=Streptomyces sp. NBC_00258 TaxID=2903642 RepID=UPI003FA70959